MMPSSSIRPWRIHQLVRFLGGWPVQCGGVVGEYGESEGFFSLVWQFKTLCCHSMRMK